MPSTETYVMTAGKPTINKDPEAVLDYSFDWGPWLEAVDDTIQSVLFILDPTLTKVSEAHDATTATVWLSGGAPPTGGGTLKVTCRITTTGGRTDDRSIFLKIIER